ncbi:MAG: TOBE domain-containing protein [Bacilli bacterium]|nr:TOBE domain-containing protein [Bacilli bacterium]
MTGKKVVKFLGKEWKCLDDFPKDERVDIVVRPEDVILGKPTKTSLNGVITSKVFKGVHYEYLIQVGKSELLAKSTKDIVVGEVSVDIEPDGIHVMSKPDLANIFPNCEVLRSNNVELSDGEVEVDLTQLLKGSKMDEDGYLVKGDKKYDLTGAKLTLEIDRTKIEVYDDIEVGQIKGEVASVIYKGDHYAIIVRTEDDEEFIIDTEYQFNEKDKVSLEFKKEDIQARLKGDIDQYEI